MNNCHEKETFLPECQ